MKKIVIISDIHNNIIFLNKIKLIMAENDYVIFLGDGISNIYSLKKELGNKLIMVKGNCDFFSQIDEEIIINIEGYKFFITHGHKYGVKTNLDKLTQKAAEINADIILFGDTHTALIQNINGRLYVNPGSIGYPRIGNPSYAYMILAKSKPIVKIIEFYDQIV